MSIFQTAFNGAFVNIQTEKQIYQFTELKLFLKQLTNDFDFIFESEETKNSIQSNIFKAAIVYIDYYLKINGKAQTLEMVKKSVSNLNIVIELL